MKKVLKCSILIAIVFCCISTVVNAALSCSLTMNTAKTEYSKGEEIVVEVKVDSIRTDDGIIAFSATLEYDKASLSLEKTEGENGWSTPSYNEDNGKLVSDRSTPSTNTENVMKMTFKVKENAGKTVSISLKDISFANGVDTPVKLSTVTKNISIKNGSNPDNNNNDNNNNNENNNDNDNNNNGNNNNNNQDNNKQDEDKQGDNTQGNNGSNKEQEKRPISNNSSSDSDLPYTGVVNTAILAVAVVVSVIAAIVSVVKMKEIDNKRDIRK